MNHHLRPLPTCVLRVIALCVVGAPQSGVPQSFHWIDEPGLYTELRHGDRPVLRYMHEPYDDSSREDRERTYKVFHHVFSPDGSQLLTNGPGGLYPHHRGLFYGFRITRYGDGKVCDTWHCTQGTHQSHVDSIRQWADDNGGGHLVRIDWYADEETVILHEEREVEATTRDGGLQIDFVSRLSTSGDTPVELDGDPQHAGFHFRAAQEVAAETAKQTYYLRTDGRGEPGETRNWSRDDDRPINRACTNRPWNAMSFVLGGERYTVLYLDHPENPKPARYSERDYGRFGSYFVANVLPERPLEVRYRLWVQEGEMTVDECEARSQEFVGDEEESARVEASVPNGFVALFNAHDLSGWQGLVGDPKSRAAMSADELAAAQEKANELMRAHWSVEDGVLTYDGSSDGANICTVDSYGDFELLVDWKIEPAGDSGIYLRGSPQVQIWDTEHEPFFRHGAERGSGALWNNQVHERFPLVKADRPTGQWNTFRIHMVGQHLTVMLNDVLVTDSVVMENYWERNKPIYANGPIELQKHDGRLWFKNIFLREL